MNKELLIEKINKGGYNKEQLLSWVECLPRTNSKIKPDVIKIGDVFMHTVFNHPVVVLKIVKSELVMGLLTSDPDCPDILEETKSRFFKESFFTKVIFKTDNYKLSFLGVYDNNAHLKEVYQNLLKVMFK